MPRSIIATANAPKAIGTYSQAVKVGSTVYASGQIPLDPATGELVQGPMDVQVKRVFENLKAVAEVCRDLQSVANGTAPSYSQRNLFELAIVPIVLGEGMAIFSGVREPRRLTLVSSKAFPKGTAVQVYRPA